MHPAGVMTSVKKWRLYFSRNNPDNKADVANMGPTWGRLYPGGPHVGHINLACHLGMLTEHVIWCHQSSTLFRQSQSNLKLNLARQIVSIIKIVFILLSFENILQKYQKTEVFFYVSSVVFVHAGSITGWRLVDNTRHYTDSQHGIYLTRQCSFHIIVFVYNIFSSILVCIFWWLRITFNDE